MNVTECIYDVALLGRRHAHLGQQRGIGEGGCRNLRRAARSHWARRPIRAPGVPEADPVSPPEAGRRSLGATLDPDPRALHHLRRRQVGRNISNWLIRRTMSLVVAAGMYLTIGKMLPTGCVIISDCV